MKNRFLLFVAVFLCALTTKAQLTVDSITKDWHSVTAYTHGDSGAFYQFNLLSYPGQQVLQSSTWNPQFIDDTTAASYTFTGLDTFTRYYVRVDEIITFPTTIAGVPYLFTTDTLITMPVITRDTIITYPSLGAARPYFTVSGGYDTSWVEVQVNTNASFTGFGNSIQYYHVPWASGAGNVYFTGLPQNQTLYIRYRVRNSQYTSQWLFNATVDTFGLWTGTVVVTPTVTTDDSVANYNNVIVDGSATVSNLLRIRYGYSYSDVQNSAGYVGGTVTGSLSSLSTSATVYVQPNTVIFYRAESETGTGTIYGDIKSVTSKAFPVMTMPFSLTDTSFTTADFLFTPNTSGIWADSFVVEVGSPTLSFLEQRFHVGTAGVKDGSLQIPVHVTGLTEGNQYQIKITTYAFGVVASTSSTLTFYTPTQGVLPTSAAWGEVTGVQDQLMISNVLKSRVQIQYKSENLVPTAWLEVNNSGDSTNIYPPLTFNLTLSATGATPVYQTYDITASDIPSSWDQYSDVYSRYIVRFVTNNTASGATHYGDWQYFYPHGQLTGITKVREEVQFSVFPNPVSDYITVSFEGEGEVEFYSVTGQSLAKVTKEYSQKVNFSTANFAPGIYCVQVRQTKDGKQLCTTKKFVKQ